MDYKVLVRLSMHDGNDLVETWRFWDKESYEDLQTSLQETIAEEREADSEIGGIEVLEVIKY